VHFVVEAVRLLDDVTHHLGSETIVSEEDVADARYQYS
jgi:hypothetical protein